LTWALFSSAMVADVEAVVDGAGRLATGATTPSQGHSSRLIRGRARPARRDHAGDPATYPAAVDPPIRTAPAAPATRCPATTCPPPGHRAPADRVADPHPAMRSLGGYFNVFAIESMMDEAAAVAGADPLEFRLAHLSDERGRPGGVDGRRRRRLGPLEGTGLGIGYAPKGTGAWCGRRRSRPRRGRVRRSVDGRRRRPGDGRRAQPDRGGTVRRPADPAEGSVRPAPDHQRHLGVVPDPAVLGRARGAGRARRRRQPPVGAGGGRPGPDRGRDRQRVGRRGRRAGPTSPTPKQWYRRSKDVTVVGRSKCTAESMDGGCRRRCSAAPGGTPRPEARRYRRTRQRVLGVRRLPATCSTAVWSTTRSESAGLRVPDGGGEFCGNQRSIKATTAGLLEQQYD
jgi:hypothetical protein